MRTAKLWRIISAEPGVALPAAFGVLLVVSILVTITMTSALSASRSSNQDNASKRALGAAEAGLQVARARLAGLRPSSSQCLTDRPVAPSGSQCPGLLDQDLGNGARYSYWVTDTAQAAQCGGSPAAGERCITALGTIAGVKRRVQARVKGTVPPNPLFPVAGILAIDGATLGNGFAGDNKNLPAPLLINGELASDRTIRLGNGDVIGGGCRVSSPNGSVIDSTNSNSTSTCQTISGITPTFKSGLPGVDTLGFQPSFVSNRNETGISWQNPGVGAWTYTAGTKSGNYPTGPTRSLATTQTGARLILRGGDYNLCNLNLANGGELLIPAGEIVRLFLDSYARKTPAVRACPGSGRKGGLNPQPLYLSNRGSLNPAWSGNSSPGPAQLQIFVYGEPGNTSTNNPLTPSTKLNFENSNVVNAMIFAPWSETQTWNDMTWNGALTTQIFSPKNNMTFTYGNDTTGGGGGTGASYQQKLWRECKPSPSIPADPETGC